MVSWHFPTSSHCWGFHLSYVVKQKSIFQNIMHSAVRGIMLLRRITVLLFILSLCLILSCLDFEAVRDPGTLYVHLGAEPGHLNPVTSTEAVASSINQHIYETLVDRDYDTLEIIPQLASGWKVAPNHLVYTFYLKKGV